jgi:hypothetical protein
MIRYLALFLLLFHTYHFVSAQTAYKHDTSGNRIKRSGEPALPVTLISFEATKENGDDIVSASILEWETSSESNSDFFEIQRSPNAKHWHNLGEVKARGESLTRAKYQFIDRNPVDGQNFYRLKMQDNDGSFAYSQIRNLHFDAQILAYPNPVKQFLKLKGWASGAIQIFSNSGKLVYEASSYASQINLGSLTTGVYILKLIQKDGTPVIKKIIKE